MLFENYHLKTKHTRSSVMQRTEGLEWSTQPEVYKSYPEALSVSLPAPQETAGCSIGESIEAARSPLLDFMPAAISLEDLSTLLYMTNGITKTMRYPGVLQQLRAAPSAGALYPTVTYLLVRAVAGLATGLYHYDVRNHALSLLRACRSLPQALAALTADPDLIDHAPVTFVFSTIFFRSSWKYKERAYRYCLLDAGHLALQTMLTAAALQLGSVPLGCFDDAGVNSLLSLQAGTEAALMLLPVGRPARGSALAESVNGFSSQPRKLEGEAHQLVRMMHGRSCLRLSGSRIQPGESGAPKHKHYAEFERIPLPVKRNAGADILETIRRRRSARHWLDKALSAKQLSSLLYYSHGLRRSAAELLHDPSVEKMNAVRLYLIINNVQQIASGVYYYDRHDHALVLIREGDCCARIRAAALFQEVVGYSGMVPVMTLDAAALANSAAERGYRYAVMDAGMLGGRLYLQAVGLGLGCSGIGAFFDDEISQLIDVDPSAELIVYMAAIGLPRADERRGAS